MMLSYVALIAAGAILLCLPAATPPGHPIDAVDALFTSASATCVTGLVVRSTGDDFTLFGQLVILSLIQLGGIGIMTFSLIMFSFFGSRMSLASRFLIVQTLASVGAWEDFWPLLRTVVRFTFFTELAGSLLLFARWQGDLGQSRAAYAAIFHSISAFCNAGFSLWNDSLEGYRDDVVVNVVISALIILGGLGFVVVWEVLEKPLRRRRMSLHTKVALWTSGALVVTGAALFWVQEQASLLAGMSFPHQLLASFFQSVTARTAGFNSVEIGDLAPATLSVMMTLMFIGGSPGSCAGGIKTTTFGVLLLTTWNRLNNRRNVNAFHRSIGQATIANTLSIAIGGVVVVALGLLALLMLEHPHATLDDRHGAFVAYMFETISALGTVGLSCGVTTSLSDASRLLLVGLMYLGRLGPLTVAMALSRENPVTDWRYPEEDVMVG